MSKRFFAVGVAFALTLTAPLAIAQKAAKADSKKTTEAKKEEAAAPKAPRLTLVDPVKDFGTVAKGEKLDWQFLVKNTGTADLEIIAARPACGCTVADFDKIIKPGQTGKVSAHVDTASFAGPISKGITLETNDASAPTAQVTISAIVKPFVEAYPGGFVRFHMLQGDSEKQSVTLYSEETEPFEIVKVEPSQPWIKVAYAKAEGTDVAQGIGRPGQNQYKLDISVGGSEIKNGPINERVHIVTNSKHQPEYFVNVTGVIRPSIRVEPTAVNFGEVAPNDTAATRTIVLRTNNLKTPEVFEVKKAESAISGVTAEFKPTSNKGEYEVTLQVAKNAKPGEVAGDIKIHTTDKNSPIVTIPVRGTIKTAEPPASK
jgi:Protein of unknown function (DUF1573)